RFATVVEPVIRAVLVIACALMCGFFFFQAEDGIRDFHVTGVQTCALPICRVDPILFAEEPEALEALAHMRHMASGFGLAAEKIRSEERRVGKECRSRWSPYQ